MPNCNWWLIRYCWFIHLLFRRMQIWQYPNTPFIFTPWKKQWPLQGGRNGGMLMAWSCKWKHIASPVCSHGVPTSFPIPQVHQLNHHLFVIQFWYYCNCIWSFVRKFVSFRSYWNAFYVIFLFTFCFIYLFLCVVCSTSSLKLSFVKCIINLSWWVHSIHV